MDDLTPRRLSVLNFIIKHQSRHAIAPSVREIATHLGLRSPGGIHRVLNILRDKGYIKAEGSRKRAWRFCRRIPGKGVPLIGDIAAGNPMAAIAQAPEDIAVSKAFFGRGEFFALRVRGHSMSDAHILDGDMAVIRIQSRVEQGEIAAVMVRDILPEVTLKIVRRTRQVVTLEPANAAFEPLVFKGKERRRVVIVGKLAGVIRRS